MSCKKLAFVFGMLTVSSVSAQEVPLTNIYDYNREDYSFQNIRAGAFEIAPRVSASAESNDNIFAAENNEESDTVLTVAPSLKVSSLWSRHKLNYTVSAEDVRYMDNDGEDHTNVKTALSGKVDITKSAKVDASVSYRKDHEKRTSLDNTRNSTAPTEYSELTATVGGTYRFNRAAVNVKGVIKSLDYNDATAIGGGVIDNDDRDRNEYTLTARLGYMIVPGYNAFVQSEYEVTDYDQNNAGENRNSRGLTFNVGTDINLAEKLKGEVYAGLTTTSYSESTFSDQDTVDFGGSVLWSATPITSVEASVNRGVKETTSTGNSGYVETEVNLDVQHELRRNLLLRLETGVSSITYNGVSSDQEADIYSIGMEAKYLINRQWNLALGLGHEDRSSDRAGESYDQTIAKLNVRYSLY